MADEREDWLARRFGVLDDVDVPALWEQIVGRSDTEPVVDVLAPRRRRWVPLVAAAVLLVAVAVGLLAFARDEPRPADAPDPPPAGANTVAIVEGDGSAMTVTPTATAGIVTLDITNPTDGNRLVDIRAVKPEFTLDEIRHHMAQYADTGTSEEIVVEDGIVFAIGHGPDDHLATSIPMAAGRYLVGSIPMDEKMVAVPGVIAAVRLLTIEPGAAGSLPAPTLTFDRLGNEYLVGDNLTTAGPATIRIDNTAGGDFVVTLVELRPDVTQHDWSLFENAQMASGTWDWREAPVASFRNFAGGPQARTFSVDLEGGDVRVDAPPSFEAAGPFSAVWVTVE